MSEGNPIFSIYVSYCKFVDYSDYNLNCSMDRGNLLVCASAVGSVMASVIRVCFPSQTESQQEQRQLIRLDASNLSLNTQQGSSIDPQHLSRRKRGWLHLHERSINSAAPIARDQFSIYTWAMILFSEDFSSYRHCGAFFLP